MNSLLTVVATVCCAAEPPVPSLRVEAIPEGSILIVRNVHVVPLTAVFIEMVDYPGGSFRFIQDEVDGDSIPPGAERRFQVRSMLVGAAPGYMKLQAAVYLDGATAGTPGKIEQILRERRFRLKAVREEIEKRAKDGPPQTLERLRKTEKALAASKPSLM